MDPTAPLAFVARPETLPALSHDAAILPLRPGVRPESNRRVAEKPEDLFRKISDLLQKGPLPRAARRDQSPVWIPRNDSGYYVVTCTECLRSFSVPEDDQAGEMREVACLYCDCALEYRADTSYLARKPSRSA